MCAPNGTAPSAPLRQHVLASGHWPYVIPFAVFMAVLSLSDYLHFLGRWEYVLRAAVLTAVLWLFSRRVISLATRQLAGSALLGMAVFVIWIAPDLLIPGYRDGVLFQNTVMGRSTTNLPEHLRNDPLTLAFRSFRAIVLVPIIEELFWRAWLMRWLIHPRFESVPLGAWSLQSMLITAVLFASEHGPYWDVGLVAGLLYNWWMTRTRSLGDCIVAHAVTNACLSAYVVLAGKWQYWP